MLQLLKQQGIEARQSLELRTEDNGIPQKNGAFTILFCRGRISCLRWKAVS